MSSDPPQPPPVHAALALVVRDGKALICQRLPHAKYGGYWEFPGGKLEKGETLAQCAVREAQEEVGIEIEVIQPLAPIEYHYPHGLVRLHPFICRHISGVEQRIQCQDVRWIQPHEFEQYQFPEANESIIRQVCQYIHAHDNKQG